MKSNGGIVSILVLRQASFNIIPFYTLSFSSALSLVSQISLAEKFTSTRLSEGNFMKLVTILIHFRLYSKEVE